MPIFERNISNYSRQEREHLIPSHIDYRGTDRRQMSNSILDRAPYVDNRPRIYEEDLASKPYFTQGSAEAAAFITENDKDEVIGYIREVLGEERAALLTDDMIDHNLIVSLRAYEQGRRAAFQTLMRLMPQDVYVRLLSNIQSDDLKAGRKCPDKFSDYVRTSLEPMGDYVRHSDRPLHYAKLVELAYGGVQSDRFAATAGLVAYTYVVGQKDLGLTETGVQNEAKLKERIDRLRADHQARVIETAPLRVLLPEPVRFGIEIECHSELKPFSSSEFNQIEKIFSICGWHIGMDGNDTYEYKSKETEHPELLAVELDCLERLGLLPFAPDKRDKDGLSLAHGIHLTTSGVRYAKCNIFTSDAYFLHHSDEVAGHLSGFDFNGFNLTRMYSIVHGEMHARTKGEDGFTGTIGGEQRTFCAYSHDQLMAGIFAHASKARALAAFQKLPEDTQQTLNAVTNPLSASDNVGTDFGHDMHLESRWQAYIGRVKQVLGDELSASDINPLIAKLSEYWILYKAETNAVFKAAALPDPNCGWSSYTSDASSTYRAALYNRLNTVFIKPEDYLQDPAVRLSRVERRERNSLGQREPEIHLGRKRRFANFVHAIRSLDKELAANVHRALTGL
jgi:hypothetical protein